MPATLRSESTAVKAALLANSSWGIAAHVSQTVLLSAFFVMLTRHYPAEEFGKYVIANALMQMMLAFSALGLGNWFIREVSAEGVDRYRLLLKFLSTQIYSGVGFAVLAAALAFALYQDRSIRIISSALAVNIVFDNIVNALKSLNIADLQQRKTFVLLTVDGLLKCGVAAALFVLPLSLVTLALLLVAARLITLNLFLILGTSGDVTIGALLPGRHVSLAEVRTLVISNWPWILLGGVSVANWRIASIIISKRLGLADTAIYEIAYRLFSAALMLPVIVATAVYPMLVRLYNSDDIAGFRAYYRSTYVYYLLFGCLAYSFVYSYSGMLLPLVFGAQYATAPIYTRQLFLTMIVFPTAFLQGNVLCAMRLERRDLLLNVVLLAVNVTVSLVGLTHWRSLTVINVALLTSFVIFHLLQDALLIRRGVSSTRHALTFHATALAFVVSYSLVADRSSSALVFPLYWAVVFLIAFAVLRHDADLREYMGSALALAKR